MHLQLKTLASVMEPHTFHFTFKHWWILEANCGQLVAVYFRLFATCVQLTLSPPGDGVVTCQLILFYCFVEVILNKLNVELFIFWIDVLPCKQAERSCMSIELSS